MGTHDENIDFDQACQLAGKDLVTQARDISLRLYREASAYADSLGIIIADTKFEFGVHMNKLILIDEVLTPDSSRFWPKSSYQVGLSPPSYDKQYVRNYLETLSWNKKAPGPTLPPEVVQKTSEKYLEIFRILTGKTL
jgi:phosphoribosylaminoimidazole-succinocarboxamide synthase